MPHVAKLDRQLGVIAVEYRGEFDCREIARAFDELVAPRGFQRGLKCIADFRRAHTALTGEEVRQLAAVTQNTDHAWGQAKWALIASDDLIYGLSRMYSALTSDHEVRTHVFRTVEAANDWLELGMSIDEVLKATLGPGTAPR